MKYLKYDAVRGMAIFSHKDGYDVDVPAYYPHKQLSEALGRRNAELKEQACARRCMTDHHRRTTDGP